MTDIQWDQPLEAVHEDGRVVPVTDNGPSSVSWERQVRPHLDTYHHVFMADGRSVSPVSGWRIRNTPQQTPTPDVVGFAPELVERMVALVRRIAAKSELKPEFSDMVSFINELIADARGIAGMVEPIDKDEALAIELVGSLEEWGFNNLHRKAHDLALAAIRRGRALERGEA